MQEQEREKQERERIAAEAARKEAATLVQVQQEFAERFLDQLLTHKEITAEDARQRCLEGAAGAGQAPRCGNPLPDRPQDCPSHCRAEPVTPRPGTLRAGAGKLR